MSEKLSENELPSFKGNQPSLRKKQERLYQMCHDYLIDNFHKFSEANKIKIALQLGSKLAPTQNQTTFDGTINANVTMMPAVEIDGKPLEADIG